VLGPRRVLPRHLHGLQAVRIQHALHIRGLHHRHRSTHLGQLIPSLRRRSSPCPNLVHILLQSATDLAVVSNQRVYRRRRFVITSATTMGEDIIAARNRAREEASTGVKRVKAVTVATKWSDYEAPPLAPPVWDVPDAPPRTPLAWQVTGLVE